MCISSVWDDSLWIIIVSLMRNSQDDSMIQIDISRNGSLEKSEAILVTDAYFINAFDKEILYLKSIDISLVNGFDLDKGARVVTDESFLQEGVNNVV
jgi:hypothetical protein